MARPAAEDFPAYFAGYIQQVVPDTIQEVANTYAEPLKVFFTGLPESKADYAYAPGKWTLKDLLQHIIDTERVMAYRLLRIARNDKTPLAPFDENSYAANAKAASRSFTSLKDEFVAVRNATDQLLGSLGETEINNEGIASNHRVTANAIGYIIFGHMLHHKKVVTEKYL